MGWAVCYRPAVEVICAKAVAIPQWFDSTRSVHKKQRGESPPTGKYLRRHESISRCGRTGTLDGTEKNSCGKKPKKES